MENEQNNNMMPEGAPQEAPQGEVPAPEPTPAPAPQPSGSPVGPIIGIIIILILIVLAGFYFWGSNLKEDYKNDAMQEQGEAMEEDGENSGTRPADAPDAGTFDDTPSVPTNELPVSNSDEIEDLEAELDTTDLDSFDSELEELDQEFEF